jgi:very-short-patch-repair endonuclease
VAYSGYTALLISQCKAVKLATPVPELRFAPPRRWRFDLAWQAERLAVEVDGAVWVGGRHTRGSGYEKDCEKFAEAVIRGWRVLRVTSGMVKDGRAIRLVERALAVQ